MGKGRVKIKAIEVARNACKVVAACNCDFATPISVFHFAGISHPSLVSAFHFFSHQKKFFTRENSKDKAEVGSPRWIDLTIRVSRDASLDHVSM